MSLLIFYSSEGMEAAKKLAGEFYQDKEGKIHIWKMQGELNGLANNPKDYRRFYHNVDGQKRSVTTRYITCLATI